MIMRKYFAVPCEHDSNEWVVATGRYLRPPTLTRRQAEVLAELLNKIEGHMNKELEHKTNEIAKAHGCDRAVFTVCWGEHERGELCRCKEEAKEALKRKD